MKNTETRAFHDPYFPVYGRNCIHIFPYLVRFSDSVQIWENKNMILSIYGKHESEKARVLAYFTYCFPVPKFYNGLT